MTTTTIRDMAKADVERVGRIIYEAFTLGAKRRRYRPRFDKVEEAIAFAWRMFRYPAMHILVAEAEGRVVAVCTVNPRGSRGGGIGPVAVDPTFRGMGVVRDVVSAGLGRVSGVESMRALQEAFNPDSFSLAYSFDFVPVTTLLELHRRARGRDRVPLSGDVHELAGAEIDALVEYDTPRSSFDRRPDFAHYLRWGKVLVHTRGSEIRGYIACLAGPTVVQLGPLVAEGEEEAQALFRHATALFPDHAARACVMPTDVALTRSLMDLRFSIYCVEMLMVRGPWRPGHRTEAFGMFPEAI